MLLAAYITFCIYFSEKLINQGLAEQDKEKLNLGIMNDTMHGAALAAVKRKVSGVVDVIITSDKWTISSLHVHISTFVANRQS